MVSKKKKIKKTKPKDQPKPVLAGYDIASRTHDRRAVLQSNSQEWGTLKILKQLNRTREDQQWNPRAHEILTKDLEYLEKVYQRERRR